MIVTCVNVWVTPENVDDFIAATVENHRNSIKEEGNLRFDVLQNSSDPCRFTLYEAYISDEAAALHKTTAHYNIWRETVGPWMAKPREGLAHKVIAPADKGLWK
ncbi:MAG: antibiotic biosynthesis monooxygenase [Spirochaetota bacterium]